MDCIKCPNEIVVHLSDEDKGLCEFTCKVCNISPDEFFHVVLDFYGRAVYKSLCFLSFVDTPFTKS